jgi:hypothetical protein
MAIAAQPFGASFLDSGQTRSTLTRMAPAEDRSADEARLAQRPDPPPQHQDLDAAVDRVQLPAVEPALEIAPGHVLVRDVARDALRRHARARGRAIVDLVTQDEHQRGPRATTHSRLRMLNCVSRLRWTRLRIPTRDRRPRGLTEYPKRGICITYGGSGAGARPGRVGPRALQLPRAERPRRRCRRRRRRHNAGNRPRRSRRGSRPAGRRMCSEKSASQGLRSAYGRGT